MREEVIYELKSLYRDNMRVRAFRFGEGEDTVCLMGATRGNEVQQIYICSRMNKVLREAEQKRLFCPGKSVMVIPTINNYSMNMGKRFWPTDNTDINRMFPGYNLGETTQRIAAGVFNRINGFAYGIQLASYYMPGYFVPHVRIMRTGYESPELACLFGLPYVMLRNPKPYDTATLNYNWQIWNTRAFSLYTSTADRIDPHSADMGITAILDFLYSIGVLMGETRNVGQSKILGYDTLTSVRAKKAGLFYSLVGPNQEVRKGDILAVILDPYLGEELERVVAPMDAHVFFVHNQPLTYASAVLFKLAPPVKAD